MGSFRTIGVAVLASAALFAGQAEAGEVRVTLTGVESRGGQLLVTLQTEGQFMQGQGAYNQVAAVPSQKGDVALVFADVAPGEYALAVMHDEDGDYQMKRAESGMPLEGWAMSNGSTLRGPPDFATVKFTVTEAPLTLTEPVIYLQAPPAQ
jgi:uncharacterized protein (DUF2141 family)